MFKNNKGFTLIEVIIAMFILTIGMLALLNTAAVVIENNLTNLLRDEAVGVAEAKMIEFKTKPFDSIASESSVTVTRSFRGISKNYLVATTVSAAGTAGDTKNVQVAVSWTHKGTTFTHTIASIVNR